MTGRDEMTSTERRELRSLINARTKLEAEKVTVLIADRIVEADKELNRRFSLEDLQIRELVEELQAQVEVLNQKIRAQCDELGVHKTLRPGLNIRFHDGGYASKDHRSELRREAKIKAEA